jgi:hypothetical protein
MDLYPIFSSIQDGIVISAINTLNTSVQYAEHQQYTETLKELVTATIAE